MSLPIKYTLAEIRELIALVKKPITHFRFTPSEKKYKPITGDAKDADTIAGVEGILEFGTFTRKQGKDEFKVLAKA